VFDYHKWSQWLEAEAPNLQSQGFHVRFNRADDTGKPGSSLGAACGNVIGSFAIWVTGEADYDITDGRGDALEHKWGMSLSDETFDSAFEEYSSLLLRLR
jgi:hypothetical protein